MYTRKDIGLIAVGASTLPHLWLIVPTSYKKKKKLLCILDELKLASIVPLVIRFKVKRNEAITKD